MCTENIRQKRIRGQNGGNIGGKNVVHGGVLRNRSKYFMVTFYR